MDDQDAIAGLNVRVANAEDAAKRAMDGLRKAELELLQNNTFFAGLKLLTIAAVVVALVFVLLYHENAIACNARAVEAIKADTKQRLDDLASGFHGRCDTLRDRIERIESKRW